MSGPDWTPVLTKGCFTLSINLVRHTKRTRRGDETFCAIGTCKASDDDPIDVSFSSIESLGEFCREMAPLVLGVFNMDGTSDDALFQKLQLAAEGRRRTPLHIVN